MAVNSRGRKIRRFVARALKEEVTSEEKRIGCCQQRKEGGLNRITQQQVKILGL